MAKRRRNRPSDDDADDPLGGLIQRYQVTLAGVLIVSGIVGVIGLGVLGYAWFRSESLAALLVGVAFLLGAVVVLGINVFNVGRRLELRKRGLRFVESGVKTELRWDEIADVAVDRTDSTFMGVATARKRSSNAVAPSGPLTNTEWDVTIRSHDGQTIRLRPMFLRTVGDPKKLIHQIRLRARLGKV
jgi:hypothetical protein